MFNMGQSSPSAPTTPPVQYQEIDYMQLAGIFRAVDKDNNGEIDDKELASALSNGTWVPFNPQTIKLMIKMFDRKGSNTITLDEFGSLWKYVQDWQMCFQSYDRDNSGFIDANELHAAITSFGFRLNPNITQMMVQKFDRQRRGTLAFDDFIQCCVMLYNLTEAFKQLDQDRDGVITIQYEHYLYLFLNLLVT